MALPKPEDWIKFVRRYGPVPRNDNQFDEQIQRAARKLGIRPLRFNQLFQRHLAEVDGKKIVVRAQEGCLSAEAKPL